MILLLACMRLPFVQTFVAAKITNSLSKQLGTAVSIEKVNINFIDHATIKGIYLEDENQDTLLYASQLEIDFALYKILQREVNIENIHLSNSVVRVHQKIDSSFNFSFIIDALAPKENADTTSSGFSLAIGTVLLENADYTFNLLQAENKLTFSRFSVNMDNIDLDALHFDIDKIDLQNAQISTIWNESEPKDVSDNATTKVEKETLSFPLQSFPISLSCGELKITETSLLYQKGEPSDTRVFNPNDININVLNIAMQDIILNDSLGRFELKPSNLLLHGKSIDGLNFEINFEPTQLSLKSQTWNFNKSTIDFDLKSTYSSFDHLLNLAPNTSVTADIDSVVLSTEDLKYFIPQFADDPNFQKIKNENVYVQIAAQGTFDQLTIDKLYLHVLQSKLNLKGSVGNIQNYELLDFSKIAFELQTETKDLRKFLGENIMPYRYDRFGRITLSGKHIKGNLEQLNFENLSLHTKSNLGINIGGSLSNLNNIDQLAYNLRIKNLQASYSDALAFTPNLPEILSSVESLNYKGTAKGNLTRFDLDGIWTSNLGNFNTDLVIDFNQDYSNANYKGSLELERFQLGNFLQNDSFGFLSLKAELDGKGLQLEDIHTTLNAQVQEFTFNRYNYQNINIDGELHQRNFNGLIDINDENITFNFRGFVNMEDSIPVFNFEAALEKINTQALNLTSFPLDISLNVSSDIKGMTINDLDGRLKISNLILHNEDKTWSEDSIVLLAENKAGMQRDIHLNSSFLNIDITGKFEIENLRKMILSFADQHFPFSTLIGGEDLSENDVPSALKEFTEETILVDISLKEAPEIASFFNIDLERLDSLKIHFALDAPNKLLDFNFFIPHLDYQDIHVDSIYAQATTSNGNLLAKFTVDSASKGDIIYVPGIGVNAEFKDQKALLTTYIENDTGGYSLKLLSNLEGFYDHIGIVFNSPLTLNTRLWDVQQSADLYLFRDSLHFPNVTITNQNQSLAFTQIKQEYKFAFDNFDIHNFAELVEIDSFELKGKINGDLILDNRSNASAITGKLAIDKLGINNNPLGNLSIHANTSGDQVDAELALVGQENNLKMQINYDINSQVLEGNVDIQKITLSSYEAFVQEFVSELEGYLTGNIAISGTTEAPTFDGQLTFNNTKAKVKALGTKYGISDGKVQVSEKQLALQLILTDEENRKANLSGMIKHKLFQDMQFDLNLQTNIFTFLNSPKDAEALFYGKFVGSLQASIKGDLKTPILKGSLNTLPESDITVQLLSEKAVLNEENYLIFLDGGDYSLEEIDSIVNSRYEVNTSVDINLLINVDEKTKLNVVIDPLTGDNLLLQGNGQLALKIPPAGNIDLTGVYTVKEGAYNFSFQKLLKRKFEIVQGSQLVFSGDPMNAQLNITASYNTEASVFPLVQEQSASLSNEEERDLKNKLDVSVALLIAGKLSEPKLSFDINLDGEGDSPVGSSAKRSLDQLKQNESELNKQVFSLLLFNSFSGSTNAGNISSTGASTAVRSVGNLINSQLNRLASKAEGLQIDFDLDQYENQFSETNSQITEIDLGISQSLLNERLVISVGGNVDLESGNQTQGTLGNVAGDFVLEYKITDDGKYKIRVFQKSDYDALNDANLWKTGAGFTYQTKFGKLRKKKRRKK